VDRLTVSVVAAALAGAVLLLSIPEAEPSVASAPEHGGSFRWSKDTLWRSLEATYAQARRTPCGGADALTPRRMTALAAATDALSGHAVGPGDPLLDSLEQRFFALGPYAAACPSRVADYVRLYGRLREAIKRQSRRWDLTSREARERLYRSLYGGRAAVEEVMLQHPDEIVTLVQEALEPSATPAVAVHGVTIHSGDILVSRGGYPTSALIARGNDYPGNFSHIGLVHVDEVSHAASVIEAHIERGVAVATAEQYLRDKKLRIMVLRLRHDLPQLIRDPMLPHRAASLALERARAGHIPYDFEMDYDDPSKQFCAEVPSSVYRELGVELWMGISTISQAGLRRWLASFGVRHFKTQEPSDLEYDPQVVVVAEWRDAESLFKDHVDNAVVDAMLEQAEAGAALSYPWYRLPVARVAKAYSWLLERFGRVGPIPQGMSPAAALRNSAYSSRQRHLAEQVGEQAARLAREQGYSPTYWSLVEVARELVSRT
jgi:hypothetical protein